MAPTTKTMGSSFGITSFKFVSFSEWKDVPRKKMFKVILSAHLIHLGYMKILTKTQKMIDTRRL